MIRIGAKTPRRATIVAVRWISALGQIATILSAYLLFEVDVPVGPCLFVLAVGALVNLSLTASVASNRRLSEREAAWTLASDVAQTAALLFFTGGLVNPFAIFILAPVVVAATVLRQSNAIFIALAALAGTTLLFFWRFPLTFADGSAFDPPFAIDLAAYLALSAALVFLPAYAYRVSIEAFDMSAALAAAQMALEQEQRLSAIGALAAAVAHQMGTPLATIKLTAAELRRDLRDHPEALEDATLIAEQAERCRDILQELSAMKAPEDEQIRAAPIMAVLQEAAEPHQSRRARIVFRFNGVAAGPEDPPVPQPDLQRRPELIHGLRNLIQNAADFAASTVWVDVETRRATLQIAIGDDGAGFAEEILDQLGEPFATTRGRSQETDGDYVGMGLGVFIAKTLLERTGARLSFENSKGVADRARRAGRGAGASSPGVAAEPSGAIVRVRWDEAVDVLVGEPDQETRRRFGARATQFFALDEKR